MDDMKADEEKAAREKQAKARQMLLDVAAAN